MTPTDTNDTNDQLATMLTTALRLDAERAPELPEEWSEDELVPVVSLAQRRPRRLALAAGLTAAAAAVTGIALVASTTPPGTDSANEAIEWTPAGSEFPSTDLGPATTTGWPPAVEDLTREVGIEGHSNQVVARSVAYLRGASAEEFFCVWEGGSGGCRPSGLTPSWSISVSSSVDNGDAATDLWMLEGLPPEVAYVSYETPDQQLWQRPVFGFVAFPHVGGIEPVVISYDRTGTELGRYSDAAYLELAKTEVLPPEADLTDAERNELWELTASAMASCLTQAGGSVGSGGVATFADDVDQVVVWSACVPQVEATVAARVTEIGPRMYRPSTSSLTTPATDSGPSPTSVPTTSD